jgi:cytochrome b subunit of formate dehydrogenase
MIQGLRMDRTIKWLVVLVVVIAIVAGLAWVFPDFGGWIGAAAIVVVGLMIGWAWLTG